MRILVTGAAGFIGSNLVDRLLARGDRVTGLDNFDPFYSPIEKRANLAGALTQRAFRLVEADMAQPGALAAALDSAQPDVVVHLAAKVGVRRSLDQPEAYQRANVDGTRALLDAIAPHRMKGLVFASSSSVYGDRSPVPFREASPPPHLRSPYAITKRKGEKLCQSHQQSHGGSVLCLRLFSVYGPRQRPDLAMRSFCALLSAGRPVPLLGTGDSERDYTWIGDILDGIIAAVDHSATGREEFEIINLGAGRAVRLSRLVELLAATLGVEPRVEHLPEHPADVPRTCADLTKARRLLGYAPQTPLEEGIPHFVRWFRESRLKP